MFRGNGNDVKYSMELNKFLNPNDLIIFDLGYKDRLGYREIMNKSAFFLTKAERHNVYHKVDTKLRYPGQDIKIVDILQKSNGVVDMELLVGHIPEKRIKCRFVAIRLPKNVAAVLVSNIYSAYYAIVDMKHGRELSVLRFFSLVQSKSNELVQIMWLCTSLDNLVQFFDKTAANSLYDKQKRKSSLHNLKQYNLPLMPKSG